MTNNNSIGEIYEFTGLAVSGRGAHRLIHVEGLMIELTMWLSDRD